MIAKIFFGSEGISLLSCHGLCFLKVAHALRCLSEGRHTIWLKTTQNPVLLFSDVLFASVARCWSHGFVSGIPQDSSAAVYLNGVPIMRRMTRFGMNDIRPASFDLAPGRIITAAFVPLLSLDKILAGRHVVWHVCYLVS